MDRKALILGGTGAMGSPLVPYLAEKYDVYITSRKQHCSQNRHIHYLHGNARDKGFLAGILKESYDVVVDFMSWPQKEFTECVNLLMDSTRQYIFTSSCRVYAQSQEPITEESPRLLDICRDEEYLATSEYALAKAREEDYIMHSGYKNWTIVRPSVTYNTNRLQLGLYEINYWLGRILRGQTVVFSKDLAETLTPMTYGKDVAYAISLLAGNPKSYEEIVQIATSETMKWKEILELYLDVLKDWGVCQPQIIMVSNAEEIAKISGDRWRLKYNRLYDRTFVCSKLNAICGCQIPYTSMRDGLKKCLCEFLESKNTLLPTSVKLEAWTDKLAGEKTDLSQFDSIKSRGKYLIARYTPYFSIMQKRQ